MSGHYEEVGRRIGEMVDGKQVLYGDSFTVAPQMLRLLYPDGVRPDQYDDLLSIVRCLDKFKRIATANDADGENPWGDVAGYAILEEGRERSDAGVVKVYENEDGSLQLTTPSVYKPHPPVRCSNPECMVCR